MAVGSDLLDDVFLNTEVVEKSSWWFSWCFGVSLVSVGLWQVSKQCSASRTERLELSCTY